MKRAGPTALALLSSVIAEAPAVLASEAARPASSISSPCVTQAQQSTGTDANSMRDLFTKTLPEAGVFQTTGLPLSNGNLAEAEPASVRLDSAQYAAGQDSSAADRALPEIGPQAGPPQAIPVDLEHHDSHVNNYASWSAEDVLADGSGKDGSMRRENGIQSARKAPIGPAMPPAELLAAAAEAADEVRSGLRQQLREGLLAHTLRFAASTFGLYHLHCAVPLAVVKESWLLAFGL